MAAFLIASLPSHLKSLEAVEYMQKNAFSYRISTHIPLMNFLMSSEGGESRQLGVFEEIEPGKEEVHVFANLTCIFPSEIKVEADSTENSPTNDNPVPIGCIVKEEEDDSMVDQPEDHNPRLEYATEAVDPVGPMEIPLVAPENPPMDAEQTEEEMVDDHQVEPEDMNSFLNQVENDDAINENILLADDQEFDESNIDIPLDNRMPVTEQGAQAVYHVEQPVEEPNVLGEMEEGKDGQRMERAEDREIAVDELLEPLDTDDSTVALRPLRNNDVLFDFEDSFSYEQRMEKDNTGDKDDNGENMEDFEEEEEELIEEHDKEFDKMEEDVEEEMEEQTDEGIDDEVMEKDEDSDKEEEEVSDEESGKEKRTQKKKKRGRTTGNSIGRHLFFCLVQNCPSSYTTFKKLEEHMEIHTGNKEFFCVVCKTEFSSKATAMVHIQERKKKECCGCGRKFSQGWLLARHLRSHTGEKPFICKSCGKGFSQISNLNGHMLTHTGKKPFSCGFCKKRFALKGNLVKHERMHTGYKPYKCSHCDYRCSNSGNLAVHNRTHTGEKPYSCGLCEKRFTNISDLKKHEMTHTGEKPFECKHCDGKFTRSTSLKRHMKKKHE